MTTLLRLCFVLVFTIVSIPTHAATSVHSRIVGGEDAKKGEFPFIISLQQKSWGHICGGSLVKQDWVLTAAHCVQGSTPSKFKIVIGLHKQSDTEGTETFTAKKIVVHPTYNQGIEGDYDYALIQLSGRSKFEPIDMNSTEIDIPDGEALAPKSITAGWGTTSEGAGSISPILKKVEVPLVSKRNCDVAYPDAVSEHMICAGYDAGGKDSCQGDSGGPLLMRSAAGRMSLIGIVSWGEGCARPKKYGVYSKVNAGLSWIDETAHD